MTGSNLMTKAGGPSEYLLQAIRVARHQAALQGLLVRLSLPMRVFIAEAQSSVSRAEYL
jgi:hypothetical protein